MNIRQIYGQELFQSIAEEAQVFKQEEQTEVICNSHNQPQLFLLWVRLDFLSKHNIDYHGQKQQKKVQGLIFRPDGIKNQTAAQQYSIAVFLRRQKVGDKIQRHKTK